MTSDTVGRLQDGPIVASGRVGDVVNDAGDPLYATTVHGTADLSSWLSDTVQRSQSKSARAFDIRSVPATVRFMHYPSSITRRPMRASDCRWTAELLKSENAGPEAQGGSIGSAILNALSGVSRVLEDRRSGYGITVTFRGSVMVKVADRRPAEVRPNMGRDHPGVMELTLILATRSDVPEVRRTLSGLILNQDSAQMISHSLTNDHGVSLWPSAPSVLLKPGTEDLSSGHFGHEQWTGSVDVLVAGLMSRRTISVRLRAECQYTGDVSLAYCTPSRDDAGQLPPRDGLLIPRCCEARVGSGAEQDIRTAVGPENEDEHVEICPR